MARLAGKVAVVTGASKGIGASVAEYMGREGAAVIVNYATSKAGADAVVERIVVAGGKASAVQADVSREEEIKRLFAETRELFGPVDVLVNNAGVYRFEPLEQVTEASFHWHFNLNVMGLLLATKEAVADMRHGGAVINVSSIASKLTPAQGSVYSATKAAVDAITASLAKELGPRGIRVNAVNPGFIETEGIVSSGMDPASISKIVRRTPLGRIGQPEDVAKVVVFLASDDSGFITGETIMATGGQS